MKFILSFVLIAVGTIAVSSCRTPSEVSNAESSIMDPDVGEGKVIYMRDCTRCHEQMVVESFTEAQWETILSRMIIKAQLDETQSRQVRAYVAWELKND